MSGHLRIVLTALALLGLFGSTSLHAQTAAKKRSANNLRQLALALVNYYDTMGEFPPPTIYSRDGKPLYSWRVAILPYIEEDRLYSQFKRDEPWDSEHNKKLVERMPKAFAPVTGTPKEKYTTHYQYIVGGGAMFEDKKKTRMADIRDGTANTIMVVEAEEAVPWSKPGDVVYDPAKALPKFGGVFKDGFYVAFADSTVHFVKNDIDEKSLRAYITRAGGDAPTYEIVPPRTRSTNNLRRLAYGIRRYKDHKGALPPATVRSKDGKPLYSWRVAILPYLDDEQATALYKQLRLDEAWDSESNKGLIDKMPHVFAPVAGEFKGKPVTYYQVLVGKGALFEENPKRRFRAMGEKLIIVEAENPVPWTKPADVAYDPAKPLPKLGGQFKEGFLGVTIGERVTFFPRKTPEPRVRERIAGKGKNLPDRIDSSPSQMTANQLKQLAAAVLDYADGHNGQMPPDAIYGKDGKALLSWRVAILPYLEEDELYEQFKLDEPWDSEHNKKLLTKKPPIFGPVLGGRGDKERSYYRVLVGGGAAFEPNKLLRIAHFSDGLSNTLLIVNAEEGVPWTKPEELPYDPKKPLPKFSTFSKGGFHAAFADGSVHFIRMPADEATLRAAITRAGGEKLDLKKLIGERGKTGKKE